MPSRFDRYNPYNTLPSIPPSGIDLESKTILKACITGRAALAELKQTGKLIPNQAVLINTIPLLEAQGSSEIENIVTTTDSLFQYASSQLSTAGDPATKEAYRYRTALHYGYHELHKRPISTVLAVELCRILRNARIDIRENPGTQIANFETGDVVYTPPEGEVRLRKKLANWEGFVNTHKDIDPLIRLAVMHYQFEAIHPFSDGNGRTGRILNILFLLQEGLLEIPVLYLSRYVLAERSEYYDRLRRVTEYGEWDEWILFMLAAVEDTAHWTSQKILAIRELMHHTKQFIRAKLPKIYSHELLITLFIQPYCRINDLADFAGIHRQTASTHLKQLVRAGVLRELIAGREKRFIHPHFLRLLTQNENGFAKYTF